MTRTVSVTIALAASALLGVSSEGRADSESLDYVTPNGLYAGIGWGHFDLKPDNFNDVDQAVKSIVHSGDDAWKVALGYRLSPYFALEGDFMNFGHPTIVPGKRLKWQLQTALERLCAVCRRNPADGSPGLFAKTGYLFYDTDLRVNLNAPGQEVFESSHSRSDFIFGGGLGATFFRHLYVSAEYDAVRVQNARSSNALWLSTTWRF